MLGLGDETLKKVLKDQEAIINGDFKGTSFSNRIWVNGQELQNSLENGLHRSLILGENPRQWSGIMHEHLKRNMSDTGKENALFNAFRLAVTETARVQVWAGLKLMKEGGYDKYIWIAEPGACHICAPFNNQVFDMKDASMGNTLPPMHPFCRCSVAAYYDMDKDEDLGYNIDKPIEVQDDEAIRNWIKHHEKILNHEKYEEHNINSKRYDKGKSVIIPSEKEIQNIINETAGTGELKRDKRGIWTKKEFINYRDFVGIINGIKSKYFSIHYKDNKWVHLVPREER
ncbi:polymorphic toxin type 50 domain-containing protein [Citroniella saccharovorans]|uniref:Polymorphic toxin type 50 domain-containing protein n=1 Tax=Citroniella saccharovorans TaxID=2053367 RepID=A0AAW9MRG9_9FIRM|nr:polymorphic toxin type 50 domain-containing protein [Citroniella saccharovorans]MEB3429709.1 polymorphic toxin type 50 domain-containing protein [Citroniella saccharovorans]